MLCGGVTLPLSLRKNHNKELRALGLWPVGGRVFPIPGGCPLQLGGGAGPALGQYDDQLGYGEQGRKSP